MKKYILLIAVLLLTTVKMSSQVHLDKYNFGEGLRFTGDSGYSMRLQGYVQPYAEFRKAENDSELYNRFRMRRLRLRLTGESEDTKFSYRLQVDLSGSTEADTDEGSNNMLLDAFVNYDFSDNWSVSFGQKTTPTDNLELSMGSQTLQLPERSRLTSVFAAIREFGLFFNGSYRLNGSGMYLKPAVAITNGDGMNVFDKDHGSFKYGGRVDFLPFGLFNKFGQYREADIQRELTPKLLIGASYSYNDGVSSRRGRNSGAILYLDDNNNEALPDYEKFGIDFLLKYQGFSLLGEFVKSNAYVDKSITQRVRTDGSVSSSFDVDGVQDVENYIKNRMMLGEGYNVQAGYVFKSLWSVDARYTHLEADKYSFLHNGAFYARPNYYTLGVTKYMDRNYGAKIQASVTYTDTDPEATNNDGDLLNGNEWTGRIIFTISF
ncbi:porin [Flavobacterium sp.]|uniref:porin n=1 Tax=Flavobacterium sp. TaxID=239 RepID=UPI003A8CB26D